jgi:hypothetical protein
VREDAARAYDRAAVQAHGTGVKRNFPGEAISELHETVGEERKRSNGGSRYIGVNWDKARSLWLVQRYDPQTQRSPMACAAEGPIDQVPTHLTLGSYAAGRVAEELYVYI